MIGWSVRLHDVLFVRSLWLTRAVAAAQKAADIDQPGAVDLERLEARGRVIRRDDAGTRTVEVGPVALPGDRPDRL